jgi:nitrogenase molybdenum-iron protein alpha chain
MNEFEGEQIIRTMTPDMFFSGIKDKYIIEKCGVYSKQIHSYDYSGPYAGFAGAYNFGRDVALGVTVPAWKLIVPKWKKDSVLEASLAEGGKK